MMIDGTAVVIGGGVIGLTTAWSLQRRGIATTLVEARTEVGLGASAANGFLLHPSLVEPWNSPGILGVLWKSVGREDSAVLLRARALPSLLGWGVRFARESSPERFQRNAMRNVRLATYSLRCMAEIDADTGVRYAKERRGTLTIFRSREALDGARGWYAKLAAAGLATTWLDRDGVVAMEPALAGVGAEIAGGVHAPGDESGDCRAFCIGLQQELARRGVRFESGTRAVALHSLPDGGFEVQLASGERLRTRDVVVASGIGSTELLRTIGLSLPVRPAKGYSLTLPREDGADVPWMPVVDASLHMAVIPVDRSRLRVAGSAEFVGIDRTLNPSRVANLQRLFQRTYPSYAARIREADPKPWTELRPMAPDGVPLIGRTRFPGLYVNTGHGHIGWTTAAGSGELLADLMVQRPPALAADDYSPARLM